MYYLPDMANRDDGVEANAFLDPRFERSANGAFRERFGPPGKVHSTSTAIAGHRPGAGESTQRRWRPGVRCLVRSPLLGGCIPTEYDNWAALFGNLASNPWVGHAWEMGKTKLTPFPRTRPMIVRTAACVGLSAAALACGATSDSDDGQAASASTSDSMGAGGNGNTQSTQTAIPPQVAPPDTHVAPQEAPPLDTEIAPQPPPPQPPPPQPAPQVAPPQINEMNPDDVPPQPPPDPMENELPPLDAGGGSRDGGMREGAAGSSGLGGDAEPIDDPFVPIPPQPAPPQPAPPQPAPPQPALTPYE
jgi:hypothetical protein